MSESCSLIVFFSISGSVFLEGSEDSPIHESFRQSVESLNGNEDFLNGTRVDSDLQVTL